MLALTMAVLILAWSAGFALFAWRAMRPAEPPPQADGIVVLTGGAGRIEAALSLLAEHRARLMLISGVAPGLDLDKLMRASGLHLPEEHGLGERISLGHIATTTVGNAIETARWAHANGLHSLIVVTAGYHMQRALAEIAATLPDAALDAYPVLPPAMLRPGSLGTLKLLISEYDKWLLVASGLTSVAHLQETT
jgi:uncharacterized SAM-binding protein YcdF (DUF218 family)